MRTGELIQLRDRQGDWADFMVGDYSAPLDAYSVEIRRGQRWDGPVPSLVTQTLNRFEYHVIEYSTHSASADMTDKSYQPFMPPRSYD
jgi:hypothetical protein